MDSGLVWAAVIKVPQTERPEQQTFIVSHSELWESKIKVWAGLVSSLLGCRRQSSHGLPSYRSVSSSPLLIRTPVTLD